MLICTLLTFALCADPRVQGAIAVGELTVPIVWNRVEVRSCMALGNEPMGRPGDAELGFSYSRKPGDVQISTARINLAAYYWPKLSPALDAALQRQYRASLWHEIGHVLTARASIDAARAAGIPGTDAFRQIEADQNAYDAESEHGIQQSALASPYRGADTIIDCTPR